jgi:anti-anti-sigma factor
VATCNASADGPPLLTVRAVSIGGVLHVVLRGELELETAQRFTDAIAHARKGDERKLLVNLAELTFVDACGLCALERAAEAVTGALTGLELRDATGLVAYVLRLCSLRPIPDPATPELELKRELRAPAVDAPRRLRARGRRRLSLVRPQPGW